MRRYLSADDDVTVDGIVYKTRTRAPGHHAHKLSPVPGHVRANFYARRQLLASLGCRWIFREQI